MTGKDIARSLAQATFQAAPQLYCTTMSAGTRLLRRSPMKYPGQIYERPYSTFLKFLAMGRDKYADRQARRALYEELRQQLARLRDEAQSLDDRRNLNRLLNNLERDEAETRLLSFPIRAHIELSNFCNLRCQMCGQAYFDNHGGRRQHLAVEAYEQIRKILPYLDETVTTGFGESLLSPYFWELMELLHWGGVKRLITNGILLDKATTQRLMKYPLNEYFISFEAIDRETYIFVRSGDYFDQVVQNIRDLDACRREQQRSDVSITLGFVAMKRNIEQLPEFVRLSRKWGADRIVVSFLHVTRPHLIPESLYFTPDLANRMFELGAHIAGQEGIEFHYPRDFAPQDSNPEKSRRVRDCYEPWEFVYFESKGATRPCCIYDKNMGSVLQTSWEEVWNSDTYLDLRTTVNSPQPEEYCAKCWFVRHVDHNDRRFHINLVDKRGVYLEESQIDQGVWE